MTISPIIAIPIAMAAPVLRAAMPVGRAVFDWCVIDHSARAQTGGANDINGRRADRRPVGKRPPLDGGRWGSGSPMPILMFNPAGEGHTTHENGCN